MAILSAQNGRNRRCGRGSSSNLAEGSYSPPNPPPPADRKNNCCSPHQELWAFGFDFRSFGHQYPILRPFGLCVVPQWSSFPPPMLWGTGLSRPGKRRSRALNAIGEAYPMTCNALCLLKVRCGSKGERRGTAACAIYSHACISSHWAAAACEQLNSRINRCA